jgi:two-component system OmpR family sensor kinase
VSRWKLRWQIAAAAAISILLGVVVLGAALQLLLSRDLHDQLDGTLRQRATDVATLSATAPRLLETPGTLDTSATFGALLIEVVDRRGRIVSRSLSLGAGVLPAGALAHGVIADARPSFADATYGDDPVRIYVAPLPGLGGGRAAGGAVVVASSKRQVDDTLDRLRRLTVLAGLVAALIAAAAALLMTRRALGPLERLSSDAGVIGGTGDPARRVSTPAGPQEIAGLAAALNDMLAALERSRDAERRFLADASHELRTPLTALRGNAAYLARHAPRGEAFADLEADIARLGRLVDALLAVAREDAAAAPAELVDLAALLTDDTGDPQVELDAPEPLHVRADGAAIARAVSNLVANAKLYGPPGAPIALTLGREGDRAAITVTDRGDGIPAELAEQASTRFWRGPASAGKEGSGLGLALVRATAERHGGMLRIAGSSISLLLPLLRDSSESRAYTSTDSTEEGSR